MPLPLIHLIGGALTLGSTAVAAPGAIDWIGDQSSASKTLDREGSKYEPKTGRVERNFMESAGDLIFQRGDDIQKEGKARRREAIAESRAGQLLDDAGQDYTADTTDAELRKKGRALQAKESYVNRILQAGGTQPKSELYGLDTAALGSLANQAERTKKNRDYTESQAYKDAKTREGVADQRYYDDRADARQLKKDERLDRIDQRTSDREARMLELGMQERMFDKRLASEASASKKERMAALIAGLANLGGAFTL
jgi:hypothetical protein